MHSIKNILKALVAVALLAALLPAGVAAAPQPTRFLTRIDSTCVGGFSAKGASVAFTWRSAKNVLKASEAIVADPDSGYWEFCGDPRVRPGDRLRATVSGVIRELVVPNITMRMDRVTNRIFGKAPARTSVNLLAPYAATATANGKGKWSFQPESSDFYGGVGGRLEWTSPANDVIEVRTFAAQLIVWIGSARFDGWTMTPKQLVRAQLYGQPGDALRGWKRVTSRWSQDYVGFFRDANGKRVQIQSGDRVVSNIASDANWIVPQIDGTANKSTNVVNGRCHDTGTRLPYYHMAIYRSGVFSSLSAVWGMLDGEGRFRIDFDNPSAAPGVYAGSEPADIKAGDVLHIWCEQNTGDYAVRLITVP